MTHVFLPEAHVAAVCKPGTPACCAYLAMGRGAPRRFCAKGAGEQDLRAAIEARLAEGTMGARGDNCSGPPEYTPKATR